MSGNRANSAAIQRRTSSNSPPPTSKLQTKPNYKQTPPQQYSPPQYSPPQQFSPQQYPPQPNPKLSFSDAIALITIRLGRVETFINNLPPSDQLEQYSSTTQPENNDQNETFQLNRVSSCKSSLEEDYFCPSFSSTSVALSSITSETSLSTSASTTTSEQIIQSLNKKKVEIVMEKLKNRNGKLFDKNSHSRYNLFTDEFNKSLEKYDFLNFTFNINKFINQK